MSIARASVFSVSLLSLPIGLCAQPLRYEQTLLQTRAIGQILARQQTTDTLLGDCAKAYPALHASTISARSHWQQTNSAIVQQATRLQQALMVAIADTLGQRQADTFLSEIQFLIDSNTRAIRDKLANYPDTQRQQLCSRLILTIRNGDWDIQRVVPDAVRIINTPNPLGTHTP